MGLSFAKQQNDFSEGLKYENFIRSLERQRDLNSAVWVPGPKLFTGLRTFSGFHFNRSIGEQSFQKRESYLCGHLIWETVAARS